MSAVAEVAPPPCAGKGDLFVPPPSLGIKVMNANADLAKALCATCPRVDACQADAVRHRADGIWGGKIYARGREIQRFTHRGAMWS